MTPSTLTLLPARAHTLTPSQRLLYMCPPGGHPIPSADACLWSSHSIPQTPPPYVHEAETGGVVSVFHHRDKACPHSSFISSKPTPSRRSVWRARHKTGVRFSGGAGCQRPFHLSTAASVALMLLKTTAGGKKPPPAAVRGCVPYAFICDVFDVRSTEVTERGGGGGSSAGLK